MNILEKPKQIEIIGMLCEGVGQRAVSRLTDTDRKTVARLALAVASRSDERFPDGTFFVDLSPLDRSDPVVDTVGRHDLRQK